ncbi:short-chain dehydrogenase [Bacillus horti]|uniref:Short-chain dehydrogenase n=1 Tax=Caldalkalibacillus horti TaxID=77523 RepID=A0ABT9VU35_9BACI|nr:short-chain dehydrogenase [Bacillus horti]MDQ0164497.1 hypothetical protein [Bacillus horti]
MKHALVVGGTGMLTDVCLWLVDEGYHLSVIGRDSSKHERLKAESKQPERVSGLKVDYLDDKKLRAQVKESIQRNGPIELLIMWVHSKAKNAPAIILGEIEQHSSNQWKCFHLKGSNSYIEEVKKDSLEEIKKTVPYLENCLYRQVWLGYIEEEEKSRWLTHEEISTGTIDAIKEEKHITLIGQLEPWHLKPFK